MKGKSKKCVDQTETSTNRADQNREEEYIFPKDIVRRKDPDDTQMERRSEGKNKDVPNRLHTSRSFKFDVTKYETYMRERKIGKGMRASGTMKFKFDTRREQSATI